MNMIASQTITMSSVEIAEFCDKDHKNVLADIRRTLKKLGIQPAEFSARYTDKKGEQREYIRLPRRETLIVVAGYRLDVRAKIIDRLDELEQAQRRPMTSAEMFLQNAELLLNLERQQAENQQALKAIGSRVDLIEDTAPLKAKPQNTETITEIRRRMNKKHGLPERIINEVMTKLPYSPRPFAMVRNSNENAQGSSFAVWLIKDVTKLFDRFVSECRPATKTTCTHPSIDGRFKMIGPAEAATSPSRGSQSPQGNTNMDTNSTAAACPATVPYSGHLPVEELDMVFAQIRTLRMAVQAASQGINDLAMEDAEIMLGRIVDQLDPIRTFLAENDFPEVKMPFLECRREWFARKVGGA